jgi:hypothetical protein
MTFSIFARPTAVWDKDPLSLCRWGEKTLEILDFQSYLPLFIFENEKKNHSRFLTYRTEAEANAEHLRVKYAVKDFMDQLNCIERGGSFLPWSEQVALEERPEDRALLDVNRLIARESPNLPGDIRAVFEDKLLSDKGDLSTRISRLAKLIFSSEFSKIQPSLKGKFGALLGRNAYIGGRDEKYVIKQSTRLEAASGEISSLLFDQVIVPKASLIDFERGVILGENRREVLGGCESRLKVCFNRFLRKSQGKSPSAEDCVLLSERVLGTNLWDFAKKDWNRLSDGHKELIFRRIGEVAFIDLIMGYSDRFVQTEVPREEDPIEGFEGFFCANMGNLMIHTSQEQNSNRVPLVYAIDNPTEEYFLKGGDDYEKYNSFLKTLLSSGGWADKLISVICKSLENSVENEDNEYFEVEGVTPEKRRALKSSFAPFAEYLKTEQAKENLKRGLIGARYNLSEKIKTRECMNRLQEIKNIYGMNHLHEAVLTRLNILKIIRG